jgi:hypothetical protein
MRLKLWDSSGYLAGFFVVDLQRKYGRNGGI